MSYEKIVDNKRNFFDKNMRKRFKNTSMFFFVCSSI